MPLISADAEQAKSTGGMICLYPSREYQEILAIDGKEPVDDIHLTLAYFGEDVSELTPYMAQRTLDDIAQWLGPQTARVFAHATFNPDEYAGRETCGVYLVGDNDLLQTVQADIVREVDAMYDLPRQHSPWVPHLTAGYGLTAADLSYVGDVVFDRVALEWGPASFQYQLND